MSKLTAEKLDQIRSAGQKTSGSWIRVGMSTCGIAAGAGEVFKILTEEIGKRGLPIRVERCGCAGQCYAEPLVEVAVEDMPQVMYGRVGKDTAMEIVQKHILGKELLNDHIYSAKVK